MTLSVSQGFKEGHCGLQGPAQFPGRGRVPTRGALCVWTAFACWDVWCGGETGWAPLLSSCVWTNVSLSNKIHRYSKGLKVTECMCSWSKLRTKGTKRQNSPTATSEESGTKAGPCACPLHSAPQRGRRTIQDTLQLTPGHPYPILTGKQLASPWGVSRGDGYLFSLFLLQQGPPLPRKALSELLVWPPVSFY